MNNTNLRTRVDIIAQWLKQNYTSSTLHHYPDTYIYNEFITDTGVAMSKTLFTRTLSTLGIKRVSARFDSKVGKSYRMDYAKLTTCDHCNGTGLVTIYNNSC